MKKRITPIAQSPARLALVFLAVLASAPAARADENLFGFLYGVDTLPKGRKELYQWVTWRHGKGEGSYLGLDLREEYEVGLTHRLQVSAYLNSAFHDIAGVRGIEDTDRFAFQGIQTSLKYMALSPYKHRAGLALYLEPGFARISKVAGKRETQWSLESKLIGQANFLDDQLVLAANYTLEREWERAPDEVEWEGELEMELTLGASYRIGRGWYAGLEGRWHTEFADADLGRQEHLARFLGPTLHYGGRKWWFTLTALPQISGWPKDQRSDRLHLTGHEKVELRLKLGYNF